VLGDRIIVDLNEEWESGFGHSEESRVESQKNKFDTLEAVSKPSGTVPILRRLPEQNGTVPLSETVLKLLLMFLARCCGRIRALTSLATFRRRS
jgi:hypothetical protein